MIGLQEYQRGTDELHRAAARLELIDRRRHVLELGFRHLETQARDEHARGRLAGDTLSRLARLRCWIERDEVEALHLVEALQNTLTWASGRD